MLTTALIQCHFDYASASWFSGLSQKNKSKFQVLQNKVVRYLLNLTPRTHVGVNEFKAVKMLPVNYRVDQLKLNLMFNIQTRHNFVGEIRIFSVKIRINPYPSFMHRCIANTFPRFISRCSLKKIATLCAPVIKIDSQQQRTKIGALLHVARQSD